MKTKKSFPWSLIAAAAVAGAVFAGVTQFVNGDRNQTASSLNEMANVPSVPKSGSNSGRAEVKVGKSGQELRAQQAKVVDDAIHEIGFENVRVLSVEVVGKNAILDMNTAVTEGFGSGSEAEFLAAIRKSLTKFPEIDTFQIRVDGQMIESLGHVDFVEPKPVKVPNL